MPELDKKSPVCPDCLACGFPFWEQLTPEEQEFLCRTTRPVKYKKGELVIGHGVSVQSRRSLRQGQREGNAASQGDLAQVHINGRCHWDTELLQHVFGLLLNGGVDTKIECHRFFHGYHLNFIVTHFALQVNQARSRY